MELSESQEGEQDQQDQGKGKSFISRRKMLASLGMAGAALATTGIVNGAVTKVYGKMDDNPGTLNNTRELWKRSLAEAGLSLVNGSFEEGGTITNSSDAIWHKDGAQCYVWGGAIPGGGLVVTAESQPTPIGENNWISASGFSVYQRIQNDINKIAVKSPVTLNTINSWRANEGQIKGRKINLLGDSISYGAGAGMTVGAGIPENSYVRILSNALNKQFSTDSYGFVSPYDNNGTGREIHSITTTGSWNHLTDAAAGHTPAGYAVESVVAGAWFNFIPQGAVSKLIKIWYDGSVTGSFKVVLNGSTDVETITTNGGGTGLESTSAFACIPTQIGATEIRVHVLSGKVRVTGISYLNDATGLEFQFNNFSRDGRGGRFVTENVIKEMAQGCLSLIWALAANDRSSTGADLAAYKQRIDWLIYYCNLYGTRLIVPDFLFLNVDDHPIRAELKRLVKTVPGATYIPFPNLASIDGQVKDSNYLINTINFTYDGVHLSAIGHRIVAEALGEALGVEAFKRDNISNNPRWKPLVLESPAVNMLNSFEGISKYRVYGDSVEILVNINTVASGTIIAYIPYLANNGITLLSGNFVSLPDASGKSDIITVSPTGSLTVYANASSSARPSYVAAMIKVPFGVVKPSYA
ncbi:SGNH/GDSL hydrolase family protein [Paenibacillus eucommiae]|uniref:SGNH hydrolase-type esterase domain-containing protein n=1 Tax=Paenibacillus eucommiae TaxID=1355755 RepID=A0ABS4INL0_9BACL|nr:hypothetical protein [Paenibacillus eucommiae]MBP1989154.1 hypothetical protein [Paenibacillus eucommiae]